MCTFTQTPDCRKDFTPLVWSLCIVVQSLNLYITSRRRSVTECRVDGDRPMIFIESLCRCVLRTPFEASNSFFPGGMNLGGQTCLLEEHRTGQDELLC